MVPRFLTGLEEAGSRTERVHAYETAAGADASTCALEREALATGQVDAIAFSSTAEVGSSACKHDDGFVKGVKLEKGYKGSARDLAFWLVPFRDVRCRLKHGDSRRKRGELPRDRTKLGIPRKQRPLVGFFFFQNANCPLLRTLVLYGGIWCVVSDW